MLITHAHSDHMGDAVELARRYQPKKIVATFEICHWLSGQGVENASGMNLGGSQDVLGTRVSMVRADHSSGLIEGTQISDGGIASGFRGQAAWGLHLLPRRGHRPFLGYAAHRRALPAGARFFFPSETSSPWTPSRRPGHADFSGSGSHPDPLGNLPPSHRHSGGAGVGDQEPGSQLQGREAAAGGELLDPCGSSTRTISSSISRPGIDFR